MIVAAALASSGCGSGEGGLLEPLPAGGVEQVADKGGRAAALIRDGGLSARVNGVWASENAQTLRVTFRNDDRSARRVSLREFGLRAGDAGAELWNAADVTGVDLQDGRRDNDDARSLHSDGDPATLATIIEVPAGSSRELDLEFTNYPEGRRVSAGDRVVATVPMGRRTAQVAFTCSDPSSWLF